MLLFKNALIVSFSVLGFMLLWSFLNYLFDHLILRWRFSNLTGEDIENIDRMDAEHFEEFLCKMFSELGYQVTVPIRKGQQNYFVITKDDTDTAVRFYKRPTDQRIGPDAVYHAVTGKVYSQSHKTLLITTTWLTAEAKRVAVKEGVEIWDRSGLFREISRNRKLKEYKAEPIRL